MAIIIIVLGVVTIILAMHTIIIITRIRTAVLAVWVATPRRSRHRSEASRTTTSA
jgi:precorrin-3B methylase